MRSCLAGRPVVQRAAIARQPRALVLRTRASAEARAKLDEGRKLFDAGDRMGAIRMYDEVIEAGPTPEQVQEALYSATCCHASFGDIELAKMTLRDAVAAGLDFEAAVKNEEWVPLIASTQCKIQLRNFSKAVAKQTRAGAGPATDEQKAMQKSQGITPKRQAPAYKPSLSGDASLQDRLRDANERGDVSELLATDMGEGLDTSLGAIARRVAILLLVLTVSGVVMWYAGLALLFPQG
ncbi:unnamed protein product [Pedinophyceae sp. YPF-701]|nr:unnamed protein product [Pedinophyceae sp. YPF-701]